MWISQNHENWLEKAVQYLLAGLTVGPELKIRKDFQVSLFENLLVIFISVHFTSSNDLKLTR